eukprot:TRINITY_DN4959_c0_g1_i1.p1 TRINITY_DN4959_c0_g1~~TRINITY_DN4959_c0_g1_i1.p1  ORF type:complete len:299 (+),score=106.68 TRINITY_DN4959_c0_g1_i1:28-897(+)
MSPKMAKIQLKFGSGIMYQAQDLAEQEGVVGEATNEYGETISELFEIAFQNIDVACVIVEKLPESKERHEFLAEARMKLGEISNDSDDHEKAIDDISKALVHYKAILKPADKKFVHVHTNLAIAYNRAMHDFQIAKMPKDKVIEMKNKSIAESKEAIACQKRYLETVMEDEDLCKENTEVLKLLETQCEDDETELKQLEAELPTEKIVEEKPTPKEQTGFDAPTSGTAAPIKMVNVVKKKKKASVTPKIEEKKVEEKKIDNKDTVKRTESTPIENTEPDAKKSKIEEKE